MAYTTINKPSQYFNTVLWTGNGSTQSITGVGFQPDFVWYKSRSNAYNHGLFDVVRGTTKFLSSNQTQEEITVSGVTAFNSNGFTVGTDAGGNGNGATFVAWNWLANGAGVSNTSGTITSTVSANTTAGFSVVSYTGNGTSGATIGHGLGAKPAMIIFKNRIDSVSAKWAVYHQSAFVSQADPNILYLDDSAATADDVNVLGNTTVTLNSTVFSLGNYNGTNGNGDGIIAYCFAEVKGFSKFGSYTGNGSTDGPFVYTGFKPAFVMRKRTDSIADWRIDDSKRNGYNVIPFTLFPNLVNEETTSSGYYVDLLSNGFKCRGVSVNQNASGGTYIYMAFAENPFVSSTFIPTTAR